MWGHYSSFCPSAKLHCKKFFTGFGEKKEDTNKFWTNLNPKQVSLKHSSLGEFSKIICNKSGRISKPTLFHKNGRFLPHKQVTHVMRLIVKKVLFSQVFWSRMCTIPYLSSPSPLIFSTA